jgi:hypothetical protein
MLVALMGESIKAYRVLGGKSEGETTRKTWVQIGE